jgi:hypothetical protein
MGDPEAKGSSSMEKGMRGGLAAVRRVAGLRGRAVGAALGRAVPVPSESWQAGEWSMGEVRKGRVDRQPVDGLPSPERPPVKRRGSRA